MRRPKRLYAAKNAGKAGFLQRIMLYTCTSAEYLADPLITGLNPFDTIQ
ncbi:hypothetical protein GJA_3668 [Janthinobacterium agaricidamnosum NBRC 102515 = DSM 9628]|uniref:Uncharacterized protein n=1 Tax=Janthinobacterium agaricidamnosum NBRC 102515 = DSM 9628 TaxID=1349767 RepID=W0VA98_9BURK|nr:hypothetical protein GJA_3668 [Janthinobacterium agaricidamnosum NBRC 102515 = DSM 9628]